MDSSNPRKRPRTSTVSHQAPGERSGQADGPAEDPAREELSHTKLPSSRWERIETRDNAHAHMGHNINCSITNHYGSDQNPPHLSSSADSCLSPRKSFMDLLAFEEMDSRYEDIRRNHDKTCAWLLRRQEYLAWRDISKITEHHGFLWIKGKAGTGKSTIMRFALENARKELRDNLIISYFFHARGVELEKSVNGMFQALLYQLFEKIPDPDSVIATLRTHGHRLQTLKLEVLKDIFRIIVENLGSQPLTCFIDALDECNEDDLWDMVAFFESLGRLATAAHVKFYVCFSSRLYPYITIKKGLDLILEDQREHDADIVKYIESELKIGQSLLAKNIKAELERRASGVFLWVCLVVKMLNPLYHRGRVDDLHNELNKIPAGLEPLFRTIIQQDASDTPQLTVTLQWILFAIRPLTCEEFYFAIRSAEEDFPIATCKQANRTREDMQRFILDSSKGLAEVTKGRQKKVQFIHESVRTYLLGEKGLPHLQPHLGGNLKGKSHDMLKDCCQRYASLYARSTPDTQTFLPTPLREGQCPAKVPPKDGPDEHPFLNYAIPGVFYHADAAERLGVSQRQFVKDLSIKNWIPLNKLLTYPAFDRRSMEVTKAYFFAQHSFNGLLAIAATQSADWELPTHAPYVTALGAAVGSGNEHGVDILLLMGADPMSKATTNTKAIDLATKLGHTNIVSSLINHGADINAKRGWYGTVLKMASARGSIDIVELLLLHGAEIDNESGFYGTALIAASYKGHTDIVRLLLEKGANPDVRPEYNGTPLHAASIGGHQKVVELLIDRGANVNTEVGGLGTPLHVASARGNTETVELLLKKNADINAVSGLFDTALRAASFGNHANVVGILLGQGSDIDFFKRSDEADTVSKSLESYARWLREDCVDLIDRKRHRRRIEPHGTALQAASQAGHENVVEILLRSGANVNAGISLYSMALNTALLNSPQSSWFHGARSDWREKVVDLLLSYGATANPRMLYEAASRGFDKAVDNILSQGPKIGLKRDVFEEALNVAIGREHEKVLDLLLTRSAELGLDESVFEVD